MAAWSDGALPPMCEPSAAMACSTRRPVTGGLVTMPSSFSRSSQPALRAMVAQRRPSAASRRAVREGEADGAGGQQQADEHQRGKRDPPPELLQTCHGVAIDSPPTRP